ncbi:MAG: class I SAM-dependent methyltransferase [Bacteroidota bacterium]
MQQHTALVSDITQLSDYKKCKICSGEIRKVNNRYNLVSCKNCGIVFFEKDLKDFDIDGYYSKLYSDLSSYNNYSKQLEQLKQGAQPPLGFDKSWVLKRVLSKKPGEIAEIGCGIGFVGNYIQSKGIAYTGFEPAIQIAAAAKELGINVIQGTTDNLQDYREHFAAVLAFEVIEHIDNLKGAFAAIHSALKPSGRFGFTVPNYNKRLNFDKNGEEIYQSGPPLHINFFTVESIKTIAGEMGFEVEYIKERAFLQKQSTMKKNLRLLYLMGTGKFNGSTIYCVLKKK